jgi:hypothetical protein
MALGGADQEPHDESQCWEPCGELGKSEAHARVASEPAADLDDAQRWRTYLKCYDQDELVAAEWDGPAAIIAFIDSRRAAQPPGDG